MYPAPPDARLPAQAVVIGVIGPDERPVAFDANAAHAELAAGRPVAFGGVELHDDGTMRATDRAGRELVSQQSFWFAWSQVHPSTALWAPADAATVERPSTRTGPAEGCWEVIDPLER